MAAANENQWREFWQRLGASGDATKPWQQLHAAYTEPWRAYHNLDHIGHCLGEFESVRQLAKNHVAVESAIWFHDAIYDTRGKDNEKLSADLAEAALLAAGKPVEFSEIVRVLILATKHNQQFTAGDAALLADIDLAILGQTHERYAEFEEQIRREYSWVSDIDFAAGRSIVLKGFLARKTVYSLAQFIERYEQRARTNLTWAITRLAG